VAIETSAELKPPGFNGTRVNPNVIINGRACQVDARTAAMLERIVRRAEKIERIQIGEIRVQFHDDRVRSLLITESEEPKE